MHAGKLFEFALSCCVWLKMHPHYTQTLASAQTYGIGRLRHASTNVVHTPYPAFVGQVSTHNGGWTPQTKLTDYSCSCNTVQQSYILPFASEHQFRGGTQLGDCSELTACVLATWLQIVVMQCASIRTTTAQHRKSRSHPSVLAISWSVTCRTDQYLLRRTFLPCTKVGSGSSLPRQVLCRSKVLSRWYG